MAGLFSSRRDRKLFNSYSKEFINNITGLFVYYYELVNDVPNVYGEVKEKRFYPPKKLHCIVQKEKIETRYDKGYLDIGNKIELHFHHNELREVKILPKSGDIVLFGIFVYEISNIIEPSLYPLTSNYFSYFKVSANLTQIDPNSIKVIKD